MKLKECFGNMRWKVQEVDRNLHEIELAFP